MLIGVIDPELTLTWYSIFPIIMTSFVFGLLAWVLYVTAAVGKLIKAFLDQPLRINLFDITPFEAIGKRSLIEALAFLGGVVLSLIFVLSQSNILLGASFWLVYIPLTLAPLAIFFFNMNPTHQVLAAEKEKQLVVVRARLNAHSKQLMKTADQLQIRIRNSCPIEWSDQLRTAPGGHSYLAVQHGHAAYACFSLS
jgi:hypothetical protein